MSIFKFICKHCGPSDDPCSHVLEHRELVLLREIYATTLIVLERVDRNQALFAKVLMEILKDLNRPQSATLRLFSIPQSGEEWKKNQSGGTMPATINVGGTANSLFQEWTGPSGTGTIVPNAGAPAFVSDNPAVATVDPASGVATGVSAGTANISATDPSNNLTASDVLTVNAVAQTAVSATLVLTPN